MSQSAKGNGPQGIFANARHGRALGAGESALGHASAALAKAGFADATLVLRWTDIAGADVARIAQPVKLQSGPEGGVLTLKCEAGAAVFLQHQTRALLDRLNSYLGAGRVVRLKLVPGRLSDPFEPPGFPARHGRVISPAPAPEGKPSLPEALDRLAKRRNTKPG